MDREDKQRYFVVGSVFMEVVTPLFRQRLQTEYTSKGLPSLHAFINNQPVIHILFHLRHRNIYCCTDLVRCINNSALPLNYHQWDLLFSRITGKCNKHCHCQYAAKTVQLEDLDITLSSLILFNCCSLGPVEKNAICGLRQYKNDYLSHNTKGKITQTEYNTLWTDLTSFVLQLDPSKQDDLIRLEKRPLDDSLCNHYSKTLLDIHKKLDEMDTFLQEKLDIIIQNQECIMRQHQSSHNNLDKERQVKPYRLGEDIFKLYQMFNLESVVNVDRIGRISGGVMMDDGRLVLCLFNLRRLLICNTDGSGVDSIQLLDRPYNVTAVNNSTVAVTMPGSHCIEMYDINNKHKLKSIPVPRLCWGITTINNKLVVGCSNRRLLMIDRQTGQVVQTIHTDCETNRVHAAGDRIFYCDNYYNKNTTLYCYSYTDDKVTITTLPFPPCSITSLQDGSLYVVCHDGSVQHVSSDEKHYKPVTTEGLKLMTGYNMISYNPNQQQLITCERKGGVIQIFKKKHNNLTR